jgi:hypothetical protein
MNATAKKNQLCSCAKPTDHLVSVVETSPRSVTASNDLAQYLRAGRSDLSQLELRWLANHDNYLIRLRVAENANASKELLVTLCTDPHAAVRIAVSGDSHLPREASQLLVCDPNPDVRYALAENPVLPFDILRRLSQDENPFVCRRAELTLSRLEEAVPKEAVDSPSRHTKAQACNQLRKAF